MTCPPFPATESTVVRVQGKTHVCQVLQPPVAQRVPRQVQVHQPRALQGWQGRGNACLPLAAARHLPCIPWSKHPQTPPRVRARRKTGARRGLRQGLQIAFCQAAVLRARREGWGTVGDRAPLPEWRRAGPGRCAGRRSPAAPAPAAAAAVAHIQALMHCPHIKSSSAPAPAAAAATRTPPPRAHASHATPASATCTRARLTHSICSARDLLAIRRKAQQSCRLPARRPSLS